MTEYATWSSTGPRTRLGRALAREVHRRHSGRVVREACRAPISTAEDQAAEIARYLSWWAPAAGGRAFLAGLQISDQRALALEELRMPALRRTTPESGQHGPGQRRRYRAARHWRSSVPGPRVRRGVWPGGLLNRTDMGSRP